MQRVLVSLVSDQTIPNVLAIRHFKPDRLLFVSTQRMEERGKVNAILKSLEISGLNYFDKIEPTIIVNENDIKLFGRRLRSGKSSNPM